MSGQDGMSRRPIKAASGDGNSGPESAPAIEQTPWRCSKCVAGNHLECLRHLRCDCPCHTDELDALIAAAETDLAVTRGEDEARCNGCGGAYRFDTSLPSVVWNRIMRVNGEGPELLCAACIILAFVKAGESFTAELFGAGFTGVPIEVRINGAAATDAALIQGENNQLRAALRSNEALAAEIDHALRPGRTDVMQYKKLRVVQEKLLLRAAAALRGAR